MVSFQTPFPHLNDHPNTVSESDQDGANSKNMKRKWDYAQEEEILSYKHWKTNPKAFIPKSFSDIELHLETPLPSEWQRCLDIQSGEIHFYNTRTQKRTLRDPRESLDTSSRTDCHMSLDLELNLPCGSLNRDFSKSTSDNNTTTTTTSTTTTTTMKNRFSRSPPPQPPPSTDDLFRSLQNTSEKANSAVKTEADDEKAEMVATACKRCHMLVMLCKSSPTCPNCKYVHPPCQTLLDLFKPKLSLSC